MVRYDEYLRIRMSESVKNSLRKYCEENSLQESKFVRDSIEKCLVSEMQNKGQEPTFPSNLYLHKIHE